MQNGISLNDLKFISFGMAMDILAENRLDYDETNEKDTVREATQTDIDNL